MPEKLLTSRTELDTALESVLLASQRHLRLFDGSLASFKLENPQRIELLGNFLGQPGARLTLVLQDPEPCRRQHARLMALFARHTPAFEFLQAPDSLANLKDSMVLADDNHAVIHFHRDQPRGKHITEDAKACHPYLERFAAILAEGCIPLGNTHLGL